MKNEKYITPDELFKANLQDHEVSYEASAWEDMQLLLDTSQKKRPFFIWFSGKNKQKNKLILITMITTAMVSMLAWMASETNTKANKTTVMHKANTAKLGSDYSATIPANKSTKLSTNTPLNINKSGALFKPNKPYGMRGIDNFNSLHLQSNFQFPAFGLRAFATPDLTFRSTILGENMQNKTKKTKPTGLLFDPIPNFRGAWIGLHFTLQNPVNELPQDEGRQYAGFNLQIMSRNMAPAGVFGAYLGFDFGMQFYGRGKNSNVVLDNSSLDSGFTRLRTMSMDFLARGHFEYGRYRIKPYFNVVAGPRLYTTGQYVESYRHKKDYENSSSNNVASSLSMMYGGAVGARIRISPVVSLDARLEYIRGTEVDMVDLKQSAFEGLKYNLNTYKLTPEYYQFKVGFLFDIGNEKEDKTKNYSGPVSSETTEYYYYDSTSKQYIRVNCKCIERPVGNDTTGTENEWKNNSSNPSNSGGIRTGPSINLPSGSGSSGKGSFPGIKSGGGAIIKPKN